MTCLLTRETEAKPCSLVTRILPFRDYRRLDGTELETVWPHLHPQDAFVVVVEQGSQIVACWALMRVWHLEGLWVHPEHRKRAGVARRLWIGMQRVAKNLGAKHAATAALTPDVAALIANAGGVQLPGSHFVLPLEGR